MPALQSEEAKELHRLIAKLPGGYPAVAQHIAPLTSIAQMSPTERATLRQWMQEQIDGPAPGEQPA